MKEYQNRDIAVVPPLKLFSLYAHTAIEVVRLNTIEFEGTA